MQISRRFIHLIALPMLLLPALGAVGCAKTVQTAANVQAASAAAQADLSKPEVLAALQLAQDGVAAAVDVEWLPPVANVVMADIIAAVQQAPNGWRAVALSAIQNALTFSTVDAGKFAPYLQVAQKLLTPPTKAS